MRNLWPTERSEPESQALHFSYEKAGLTIANQPIPWNAEAVLVEASLRLPQGSPRRKADFSIRLGPEEVILAESMRLDEHNKRHRLFFRLPTPQQTSTAELLWRSHVLGRLALPILSREEFLHNLTLQSPTLSVRLGDAVLACQTFVSNQCKGLVLNAILSSPTGLVPVRDLDLRVELRSDRSSTTIIAPVHLSSSQLAARQALVTVAPPRFPRRIGAWTAKWVLGEKVLASHQVRAISQRQFLRSIRISDTRFLIQDGGEEVVLTRSIPTLGEKARVGPCFLVSSNEPGMAGLCPLQVRVHVSDGMQSPLLGEEPVLITDGPTVFAPGTLDVADLEQATAFELLLKNSSLGTLPLSLAPTASFTAEGGFKGPTDFLWTPAAEEELSERINRLFDGPGRN